MVEFESVNFSLPGRKPILEGLSLEVQRGEAISIVGRSGAGKTTLLRLVNRMIEPTGGTIRVAGRSTRSWDAIELRRSIGYVIQEVALFPHWSVRRNVGLVPELCGWSSPDIERRSEEMLEMVGLSSTTFGDRRPGELSGGERQRVGLARALAADPPLLLLDEPFGSLDPVTRIGIRREFASLVRRLGKAVVLVTHDLREALAVSDRVGLLTQGRVAVCDAPDRFVRADHPEVKSLLQTLDDPPATS